MNRSETDQAIALTLPDDQPIVSEGHPLLNKEVLARFNVIADGYRDTLRKTKRDSAEKRKDVDGAEAANFLALPGDSINPYTYVAYAFDKHGNLSVGKGKGRLRPHRHPLTLLLSFLTNKIAAEEFEKLNVTLTEGKEAAPADFIKIINGAMKKARNQISAKRQAKRKKHRDQQKRSRRVNRKTR